MKVLGPLLKVLELLVLWYRDYLIRKELEKAEEERRSLYEDPNTWFDTHFGVYSDESEEHSGGVSDTSKADTDKGES